jgi:phospholipid-binding lipoprotein MlaA
LNNRFVIVVRTAILVLIVWSGAVGCAAVPVEQRHPADPFEGYNRAMFAFNDRVDRALIKPVAVTYQKLPSPIQTGVGNFFGNLDDVRVALNNLLQGKPAQAVSDVMRVTINSTLGLGGLIDLASPMGLVRHNEDFGQTLGYWGVPSGPYLVLPLLGPSTVRDAPARVVDARTHPFALGLLEDHDQTRAGLTVLNVVQVRASVLAAEDAILSVGDDRYALLRDAWLQRREFLVRDGEMSGRDDFWRDELDALDALEELERQER